MWQTTCTLVRSGEEAFAIDSPVYPDELEVLPALAAQSGFPVRGLLATHADWDHLLGRLAFPEAALGCAETTAARLAAEPGDAQRKLRDFDEEHYVAAPAAAVAGGGRRRCPCPGRCEVGTAEVELQPADGHTADGMAVWIPWARVLVCGDYLSPVEIPMISEGGSAGAYLATLARLEPSWPRRRSWWRATARRRRASGRGAILGEDRRLPGGAGARRGGSGAPREPPQRRSAPDPRGERCPGRLSTATARTAARSRTCGSRRRATGRRPWRW